MTLDPGQLEKSTHTAAGWEVSSSRIVEENRRLLEGEKNCNNLRIFPTVMPKSPGECKSYNSGACPFPRGEKSQTESDR